MDFYYEKECWYGFGWFGDHKSIIAIEYSLPRRLRNSQIYIKNSHCIVQLPWKIDTPRRLSSFRTTYPNTNKTDVTTTVEADMIRKANETGQWVLAHQTERIDTREIGRILPAPLCYGNYIFRNISTQLIGSDSFYFQK